MTRIQGIPDPGPGLRLHLNENTGGCSPKVIAAVRALEATALATYPDFRDAVRETAAYLDVDADALLLTNGLDEGLLVTAVGYLTARTPPALAALGAPALAAGDVPEVIVAMPAFDPYLTTSRALGARIVSVEPGPDFRYPLEGVLAAVTPATRLIYINNPCNPTGAGVSKDDIRRVIAGAPHAVVFLDEAYHDFMGEHFLDEALTYPNVVVGRTFSKVHGLAGMRIGVLIARPAILEPIRAATPVFNLSVVALAALRAALTDTAFRPWYLEQTRQSRELVYDACARLGLRYWKSGANFVLIDGGDRARAIVDGMMARKVFVRDRTRDPYCPNCFRLTTGVVEHTRAGVTALEELCAKR